MPRRIALSLGNTRIATGIFADGELEQTRYFLQEEVEPACELIANECARGTVEVALCSVVPDLSRRILRNLKDTPAQIFEVSSLSQTVLTELYPTVGADRIANAAAAFKLYADGAPTIVLDFGTATTMTVVSETGQFLGGLITLGLGKTFSALHQSTAQLPELGMGFSPEDLTPLARDTHNAISSGCVFGHVGIVRNWIALAKASLNKDATVVGTGGYSTYLRSLTKEINVFDQQLTLKGINLIAEYASDRAGHSEGVKS
jgi:type III pantothenate kinase